MSEFVQVNTNLTIVDAQLLDRMMVEDGFDNRSAFVRRLIRQEWARRNQSEPTTPEDVEQTMTNVMSLVERIMRTFKNEE